MGAKKPCHEKVRAGSGGLKRKKEKIRREKKKMAVCLFCFFKAQLTSCEAARAPRDLKKKQLGRSKKLTQSPTHTCTTRFDVCATQCHYPNRAFTTFAFFSLCFFFSRPRRCLFHFFLVQITPEYRAALRRTTPSFVPFTREEWAI